MEERVTWPHRQAGTPGLENSDEWLRPLPSLLRERTSWCWWNGKNELIHSIGCLLLLVVLSSQGLSRWLRRVKERHRTWHHLSSLGPSIISCLNYTHRVEQQKLLWERKAKRTWFLNSYPKFPKTYHHTPFFSFSTVGYYFGGINGSFLPGTFWLPDGGCTVKKGRTLLVSRMLFMGPPPRGNPLNLYIRIHK